MELLKKLTQNYGPSGCETSLHGIIKEEISKYVDEIYTDALGNLIAHKKGNGKKVMVCAHVDEIGIMATHIDEKGYIRFTKIGGIGAATSLYQRVKFANGTVGVVSYDPKDGDIKSLKLSNMYIDIGALSKEEAEKLVSVGDEAMFIGDLAETGSNVISKAMDDRAGVYVMIEALKVMKDCPNDLYYVFTSQEEVGLRGAKGSAFDIEPDVALAIDVTDTGDTPGCPRMAVKLGDGACIKIIDSSILCSKVVRDLLDKLAEEKGIKVQYEVLQAGGTDAGAIHLSRGGVLTGGISIPTRYIHTPSEMVNKFDLKECVRLVAAFSEHNMEEELR